MLEQTKKNSNLETLNNAMHNAAGLILIICIMATLCFASACSEQKKPGSSSDTNADPAKKSAEKTKKATGNYTPGTPLAIAESMIGQDVNDLITELGTLRGKPKVTPTNDGGSYEGIYKFDGFTCYTLAKSEGATSRITEIRPNKKSKVYRWSIKLTNPHKAIKVSKGSTYNSKDEVAKYIYSFKRLPANYVTKKEARAQGWKGGALTGDLEGKAIGGSVFGNREEILPMTSGRTYRECDIDTIGKKSRGAKRIVYSNDGVIFYTKDHYKTFEKLYG